MAEVIIKDFNDAHRMGISAKEIADRAWADPPRTAGATALKVEPVSNLIIPSRAFVAGFVPPDYLIDGILQRRFIYSMTAPTGGGKTTILLRKSVHVALALPIGSHGVERGRVLYLAGENPDDIRMRWIGLSRHMGFDIDAIDVHFIEGRFSIPTMMERIRREADALGGFNLVNIDTSAAYFEGVEENDNVQMGAHARMLRETTTLPGGPCVIVACHPTKNAGNENLLPRGGGAFLAEVDGNLVCQKRESIIDVHWQGKFRGPDFNPISFEVATITCDELKDSKGRLIPTVMCEPLSETRTDEIKASARKDEDAILIVLQQGGGGSHASMCRTLGWLDRKGEPQRYRVTRALKKLKDGAFAREERDRWTLTEKGKKEVGKCS